MTAVKHKTSTISLKSFLMFKAIDMSVFASSFDTIETRGFSGKDEHSFYCAGLFPILEPRRSASSPEQAWEV